MFFIGLSLSLWTANTHLDSFWKMSHSNVWLKFTLKWKFTWDPGGGGEGFPILLWWDITVNFLDGILHSIEFHFSATLWYPRFYESLSLPNQTLLHNNALCVFTFRPAIWIRTLWFIESVQSTSWVLVSTQRCS